jgi:hypothetical protein
MNDDKIDLNDLANRHQLSIVPREEPDERDSRIRIEEADAAHRRRKDLLFSISALVVIGVALCLCVWVIVGEGSTAASKERAWPFLTAIVTGLVGYVTGRATK